MSYFTPQFTTTQTPQKSTAQSLGQNVTGSVFDALAGGSVAAMGPIGFLPAAALSGMGSFFESLFEPEEEEVTFDYAAAMGMSPQLPPPLPGFNNPVLQPVNYSYQYGVQNPPGF